MRYARACIGAALGGPVAEPPRGRWAEEARGTFVTLRFPDGRLQGCIGNVEPRRSVVEEIAHNAVAAATLDPRADALSLADVAALDVEVSILSPLEPIAAATEAEALVCLTPHVHGVVLARGSRRATFLPVMWSRFADGHALLGALRRKARLPEDLWDAEVRIYRYTVDRHVGRGGAS